MWSIGKLFETISLSTQSALTNMFEVIRTVFEGDPETRRRVAFSIAMIALSAKMAKADGVVTPDEVVAFQEIFEIPQEERENVARLYNLAKQDVAGYEVYAERLSGLCGSGHKNCQVLEDILDGLYHIAKADGVIHEKETEFLAHISQIFGFDEDYFERITARHVHPDDVDPYTVLGISADSDFATIKSRYRQLAAQSHPDALRARGVPDEFLAIANDRMAMLNLAYAAIEKQMSVKTYQPVHS